MPLVIIKGVKKKLSKVKECLHGVLYITVQYTSTCKTITIRTVHFGVCLWMWFCRSVSVGSL